MKGKLLKEEKAKVGRPKLAEENAIKKAKISIAFCFLLCLFLVLSFICQLSGESFNDFVYKLSFNKLTGMGNNPNGFIEKSYYDSSYNYVMEIKIPDSVDRYSGSYKYTTYYLKGNDWVKDKTENIEKGTRNIKLKLDSKKNENITWKIKFQIVNGAKIKESYAPYSWKFVDAKNASDKYVYKIFTVKGYYSPVTISEIKEANKNKKKLNVTTDKKDPRTLNVNLPDGNYDVLVKYTDITGKDDVLAKDKNVSKKVSYKIPSLDRSTKVTIMVYSSDKKSLEKNILSNWKIKSDKNKASYATNYYVVKPEKSYEN